MPSHFLHRLGFYCDDDEVLPGSIDELQPAPLAGGGACGAAAGEVDVGASWPDCGWTYMESLQHTIEEDMLLAEDFVWNPDAPAFSPSPVAEGGNDDEEVLPGNIDELQHAPSSGDEACGATAGDDGGGGSCGSDDGSVSWSACVLHQGVPLVD